MSYKVAVLPHYYQPDYQGENTPDFLEDDFETIKEAQAAIEKENSGIYVTAHNESGRPSYFVVEEHTAEYVQSGRWQDLSNYNWPEMDCDCCCECSECMTIIINQDREYIESNAV